ncbi:DUF1566 domain-containing protein [Pseudacidovorax sp. RU35E]|uniref:DUF1566 domain-containing protein n=1 Tax=Pseudacidovorax sp. RU35E TaxID=1907403 RepID=UPI0009567514|nr:DUF1566 domain-containing protein [Pseudacidovorax sp. RU35E]SIR00695.1 hypothetical protein SAMN05880557_107103 [Pseudacidovorax sp. RU35E]
MTITLQAIEARLDEVAGMVQQYKAEQSSRVVEIAGASIALKQGERYAGAVIDDDGQVLHHLMLMAGVATDVGWKQARAWAEAQGGELPTRQEQALLFANCKPHLLGRSHWSCEVHEDDASYAWDCYFDNGIQSYYHQSAALAAVAVRRIR